MLVTTMIGTAYADLARMEHVLANSGLDWLVLRFTRRINGMPYGRVRVTNRFVTAAAAWWMMHGLAHPT